MNQIHLIAAVHKDSVKARLLRCVLCFHSIDLTLQSSIRDHSAALLWLPDIYSSQILELHHLKQNTAAGYPQFCQFVSISGLDLLSSKMDSAGFKSEYKTAALSYEGGMENRGSAFFFCLLGSRNF